MFGRGPEFTKKPYFGLFLNPGPRPKTPVHTSDTIHMISSTKVGWCIQKLLWDIPQNRFTGRQILKRSTLRSILASQVIIIVNYWNNDINITFKVNLAFIFTFLDFYKKCNLLFLWITQWSYYVSVDESPYTLLNNDSLFKTSLT